MSLTNIEHQSQNDNVFVSKEYVEWMEAMAEELNSFDHPLAWTMTMNGHASLPN